MQPRGRRYFSESGGSAPARTPGAQPRLMMVSPSLCDAKSAMSDFVAQCVPSGVRRRWFAAAHAMQAGKLRCALPRRRAAAPLRARDRRLTGPHTDRA